MGNHDHHGHHDHAGHGHDHGHDHGPGHAHVHAPTNFGKAFAIGISLNTALVVAEAIYGYIGNSTALLADAGHNLSDVLGLVVAWCASIAARRAPSGRFTYGLRASTILAALANAVFLLVATGAIGWEAVLRLREPEPVAGVTVMVVAGIGILVNGFTAMLFARGRKDDINIEGALSAHGGRRRSLARRRHLGGADHLDRLALARSRHQPRHLRHHSLEHDQPAPRLHRHVDGGSPQRHRPRRGQGRSCWHVPACPGSTISTSGRSRPRRRR
ncbi:hypothetical protein ACVWW4_009045 [Bradyrhizobium sp. LB7.1]